MEIVNWLIGLAREIPPLLPVAFTCIYGFVSTHHYKMALPLGLGKKERDRRIRRAAFWRYSLPVIVLWPVGWNWQSVTPIDVYAIVVYGLMTAVAMGFSSILIYPAVMRELYRRNLIDPERWSKDVAEYKEQLRAKVVEAGVTLPDGDMTILDLTRVIEQNMGRPVPPASEDVTERLDHLRREQQR